MRASFVLVGFAFCFMSASCSGGPPMGKVSGKVTAKGQPVTGGSLTFMPETGGGKPGTAEVGQDGSFVVGTNSADDGTIAGKSKVVYSAPVIARPAGLKDGTPTPRSPYEGMSPKQPVIDVKEGANTVEVELVPAAK
jgi:hypothetical protein